VIENEKLCLQVASALKKTCERLGVFYIFKASYDKANRTSAKSFRGPGLEPGLAVLAKIRAQIGVPVLTDVHTEAQTASAAEVVDILQIPAFLCRQTDLINARCPHRAHRKFEKGPVPLPVGDGPGCGQGEEPGASGLLTDARQHFSATTIYRRHALDSDHGKARFSRHFSTMSPTHSVQLPGGAGHKSAGQRSLRRCWPVAPWPPARMGFSRNSPPARKALSDGPNMIRWRGSALVADL